MNQRKLKYPELNNDAGFAAARAERLTRLILALAAAAIVIAFIYEVLVPIDLGEPDNLTLTTGTAGRE